MVKKILYIIGGIIGFIFLLGLISPHTPPVQQTQQKQDVVVVQSNSTATNDVKQTESVGENKNKIEESKKNVTTPVTQPSSQVLTTKNVSIPETAKTPTTPQYTYYSVVDVVDGDTVKINIDGTQTTLRLIGIDTPETVDPRKPVQCFGREASNKAKEFLSGQKVRIEKDPTQGELDKYGRLLVYIWRQDGLFFNKSMIEQGYAHEYTYDLPYKYQSEFKAAEKYARENQLGLWSPTTCNGNTTTGVSSQTTPSTQATGKYYTSSYNTSKYYYPENCDGWKSLSQSYLKAFDSLETLLASYPSKTLSPQCQ